MERRRKVVGRENAKENWPTVTEGAKQSQKK
jgi:hypothetical protein